VGKLSGRVAVCRYGRPGKQKQYQKSEIAIMMRQYEAYQIQEIRIRDYMRELL
jgi:hypothetical protein